MQTWGGGKGGGQGGRRRGPASSSFFLYFFAGLSRRERVLQDQGRNLLAFFLVELFADIADGRTPFSFCSLNRFNTFVLQVSKSSSELIFGSLRCSCIRRRRSKPEQDLVCSFFSRNFSRPRIPLLILGILQNLQRIGSAPWKKVCGKKKTTAQKHILVKTDGGLRDCARLLGKGRQCSDTSVEYSVGVVMSEAIFSQAVQTLPVQRVHGSRLVEGK